MKFLLCVAGNKGMYILDGIYIRGEEILAVS